MKLSKFGRAEHVLLSKAIERALGDVAKEFGVVLSAGGGIHGERKGMIKIAVELETAPGEMPEAERIFRQFAHFYDMSPDAFGATVRIQGDFYKIVGMNPNRPKNLLSIERVRDGKSFKCPLSTVKAQLPMKAAA